MHQNDEQKRSGAADAAIQEVKAQTLNIQEAYKEAFQMFKGHMVTESLMSSLGNLNAKAASNAGWRLLQQHITSYIRSIDNLPEKEIMCGQDNDVLMWAMHCDARHHARAKQEIGLYIRSMGNYIQGDL